LIHTVLPLNEDHREDIAKVLGEVWQLYADLKSYKQRPTQLAQRILAQRFDAVFSQKARYEGLNELLKRLRKNKAELLLVPQRPDPPPCQRQRALHPRLRQKAQRQRGQPQ
jgi:hypothetical protein